MNKPDDITSTEKLLDIIKKKRGDLPPNVRPAEASRVKEGKVLRLKAPRKINPREIPSIGIDIGHDCLRLVRASQASGEQWHVEDIRKVDIPDRLSKNDPEFAEFLKTALETIIGASRQAKLWVIMSAANVDVQNFYIPKLPQKQIANAVYWTLKKKAPFDEKEMVFDFELRGEVIEQGTPKLSVMVYSAPRREIEDIKSLFARIGRPLTGISIVPFALQNIFRTGWIEAEGNITASLYIGNDFSRIDIYSHDNLVMTRGIKTGSNSMVDALVESYNNSRPNAPSLTFEQGRKLLFSICRTSSPLSETDAGFGTEEKEIFEMIQPTLERIARQADMTFKYFSSAQQEEKTTSLFVSGAMSVYQPLLDYIGAQLDIACNILNPLRDKDTISLCEKLDDIQCLAERISFTPALGLALSDNAYTPNFTFTFKDKERETSVSRINQGVFAAFIVAVVVFGAIFFYQNYNIRHKQAVVSGMERTLSEIGQEVDRGQLMKMAEGISRQQNISKVYAERYLGMALISEFAALTPSNIRLVDLKMNFRQAQSGKTAKGETQGGVSSVDGLIFGERQTFETSLAGYVIALEASPLFSQVAVQKNDVEPYAKDGALHFILNFKMEDQVHG